MKFLAIRYDRQASARREAGDTAGAIELFRLAIQQAPTWSVPWYNLGLTYKYLGDWEESFRCNAEALRLDPKDEAAIWNLGIAATALGRWPEARRSWALYGIEIPPGSGPIEMNLGLIPIRINADSEGEVVWAQRIDPARAVVASIPLPESNHRHGDLVLHDGAPAGYRMSGGEEVPVFNELGLLAQSTSGTFEVRIVARSDEDLAAFERACEGVGCATEDWSNIRMLCRECSEGRPHVHQEAQVEGEHRFAVAAPAVEVVEAAVSAWLAEASGRTAGEVVVLLKPLHVQ